MTEQKHFFSQFDESERVPSAPASPGKTDTSAVAADAITPSVDCLKAMVLKQLKNKPGTADEIAARIQVDKLAIRPRCTELRNAGLIKDTGQRRKKLSVSGRTLAYIVWEAV